jgi:hypothetical protein
MAGLGTGVSLIDVAKRLDPNGRIAQIAGALSQTNDIITDITWKESNLPTGHQTTVRTSLPTVAWRLANQGVTPSKSTTAQNIDSIGMLESWFEVDKDVADLNGNTAEFRLSEAKPFVESMGQELVQTLFYGNAGLAPEEFTGLSPRYSATTLALGQNIILGGGSQSDNSSIWLICWDTETVTGLYPKGSQAGLVHENLGLQTVTMATGVGPGTTNGRLRAYQDHWQWKAGLSVKDWRYAVRIANIDISSLVAKSSAADLFDLMIKATHRIPNMNMGKCVFYMNRTCFQMLDIQARDDVTSGGQLTYQLVDGRPLTTFRGIPVRLCDQLVENEAVVS